MRFTLEKFKGEKIKFQIPDKLDDDFFAVNDGFQNLSAREDGLILERPQDNQPKQEVSRQANADKMLAEFGY